MSNSYFDKFIDDQLERARLNKQRRQERIVEEEHDLKRKLLRRYREAAGNLVYRNRKRRDG